MDFRILRSSNETRIKKTKGAEIAKDNANAAWRRNENAVEVKKSPETAAMTAVGVKARSARKIEIGIVGIEIGIIGIAIGIEEIAIGIEGTARVIVGIARVIAGIARVIVENVRVIEGIVTIGIARDHLDQTGIENWTRMIRMKEENGRGGRKKEVKRLLR